MCCVAPALNVGTRDLARLADRAVLDDSLPDKRLRLLYACAPPGITPSVRAPLMLQTILGLSAEQIGSAFLVSPSAMGARLGRVKQKIRDVGIPLDTSPEAMSPERLGVVCEAVYAAFATGDDETDPDTRAGLSHEAIWLGRMIRRHVPDDPEVAGLLSLMLFIDARSSARRGPDGAYIPLDTRDPERWHRGVIREANRILVHASRRARPGRFQLEAAIQSVHAARAVTGRTDWRALDVLYAKLVCVAPTLGARLARIAVIAETGGPGSALRALDDIARTEDVTTYQPYWATRAHIELRCGVSCRTAAERAAALTEDDAVRRYVLDLATKPVV